MKKRCIRRPPQKKRDKPCKLDGREITSLTAASSQGMQVGCLALLATISWSGALEGGSEQGKASWQRDGPRHAENARNFPDKRTPASLLRGSIEQSTLQGLCIKNIMRLLFEGRGAKTIEIWAPWRMWFWGSYRGYSGHCWTCFQHQWTE